MRNQGGHPVMKPETERKKSWDKDPISIGEWKSNQAVVNLVRAEDSDELRTMLKNKLKALVGSHPNPLQHSTKMAAWLIKKGLLIKPDWHERSTLTLEHFLTEELAEAYTNLKSRTKKEEINEDPF